MWRGFAVVLMFVVASRVVSAQPTPEETVPPAALEPPAPRSPPPESPTPSAVPVVPPSDGELEHAPPGPSESIAKPAPTVNVTAASGQGLTVRVGEVFSLNLRARALIRAELHASPADANGRELEESVGIGTLRLWFSGTTLVPKLKYMIQLALADRDYRDGAISPVFDAFLDYKAHRDFSVRVGQFFVPFDRLRTVREFALQLADRSRPVTELTLDRDVGITMYSDHFLADDSPLAWRVGVFGGNGINRSVRTRPGALLLGRIELRPLGPIDDDSEGDLERRRKPGIAIGGGVAANLHTDRLRSTTGATFVNGETTSYYHAAVDTVFKWHGVGVQLEYLWRRASREQLESVMEGVPVTEYARSGSGWVVQASYTFDPPFELVGRISRLRAFRGTAPQFASEVDRLGQEYALGANYYFNGHQLKVQADWIARSSTDPSYRGVDHLFHVLLDATF